MPAFLAAFSPISSLSLALPSTTITICRGGGRRSNEKISSDENMTGIYLKYFASTRNKTVQKASRDCSPHSLDYPSPFLTFLSRNSYRVFFPKTFFSFSILPYFFSFRYL
ncbi:hypothetical protein BB560_006672 [Smittium megazygosporum]|uniref:Secreted protein n=1 Tax=Smittium megazygosporum TaxID=133381 RepID=A0A2T9Y2J2_9FUNG|nr:hypothetical protein BB560_006672 [Smittium megazygosporum]